MRMRHVPSNAEVGRIRRSHDQARATYDALSRWYDLVEGRFEQQCLAAGVRNLAVREGERVLEIGFGTGRALVALALAVGSTGKVYGVDISGGMCAVTRARVSKAGLLDRVELIRDDAVRLPFEVGSLDAIFMSFTLELFDSPEIPLVLGECYRVLCPAGRIGIVALASRGNETMMARLYGWAHMRFPLYVDCRPIRVEAALERAGFRIRTVTEAAIWGLPVDIVIAHK